MALVGKKDFNWINITRVPDDEPGVYAFWGPMCCIYVGQTTHQSLQARLIQHYTKCHNRELKLWLQSSVRLRFSVEVVDDLDLINNMERTRIKQYAPLTNVLLV